MSISDKKSSQVKEHISAYLENTGNKDGEKKPAKRRTKEERATNALDQNYSH